LTSVSLRLRVAAEPSHLTIARAFIGSSLRALDQPQQHISDLRLAVSELMAVLAISGQGHIDVVLSLEDQRLVTTISGPPNLPPVPTEIVDIVKELTADALDVDGTVWVIRTPVQ
jgi:anti-sigma regulatory factor (Ser/Thr protein kinase)